MSAKHSAGRPPFRVLVIGQNSTWQKTYRLTHLRCGEVNRIAEVHESAAGKGANLARVLHALGVSQQLLGYAGGTTGARYRAACQADGVATALTEIEGETRVCTTVIETGDGPGGAGSESAGRITELVEPAPHITAAERDAHHRAVRSHLAGASLLALQGTAMRGESEDCYADLAQAAQAAGVLVLLDSSRDHARRALETGPHILKVNQNELEELTGLPVETAEQRKEAYRHVVQVFGVRWIFVTRGAEGAEAYNGSLALRGRLGDRLEEALPQDLANIVNPIGSGDAFSAGVIALLARRDQPFATLAPDSSALRAALADGIAAGTANALSLLPGYLDAASIPLIRECVRIETL